MFTKLLELYKFNIDEQTAIEKQEMRSKKKSIPMTTFYVGAKVKRGGRKFTMEDLEQVLEDKK